MTVAGRKSGKGRRWIFLLAMILLIGAAYLLGWSNVFTINRVDVIGAPSSTETTLIKNSIPLGQKLARLEPKHLNATLTSFAWLDRYSVSKNWLNGIVKVQVWTRTPLAVVGGKLIDGEGKVFELPGNSGKELPLINSASLPGQLFAVKLLVSLPQNIRKSLLTITTVGTHSARLVVLEKSLSSPHPLTIIWGDLSSSELKGRVYYSLIALPENDKISLVDVSAPHAPIVK
jgi:cell division septal protein FtsQ